MKSKKKILIGSLIVLILAVALITVPQIVTSTAQAEEETTEESIYAYNNDSELDKVHLPIQMYKEEGYDDFKTWWEELQEKRKSYEGVTEDIIAELDGYLSNEEISALQEKELKIINARCFADLDQYIEEYEELVQPAVEKKNEAEASKGYSSSSGRSGSSYSGGNYSGNYSNFRSAGVLYDSGYRYTYYSSNVLYHYNTANWDLGDDGIYRENGRVVVASDAYPNGTVLNTEMFGECIVRDCGVGRSDTLDVYTAY